jgi:alpha-L-fucosidase 2
MGLTTVMDPELKAGELALRYDQPAARWEQEALPIGNGSLGAMVFGGVPRERIQFNEESLWIGDEIDTGAYQAFGDLYVELNHTNATGYRRQLDLGRAVHTVTYESGGVRFGREYFASHPAQLLVFRFTADRPGVYGGRITLKDAHRAVSVAGKNRLTASGSLAGLTQAALGRRWGQSSPPEAQGKPFGIALDYESQVLVLNEGGTLEVKDGAIVFSQVDALTILLAAGTDFVQDRARGWRGEHPHAALSKRLEKAATTSYENLLDAHLKDYQKLFGRLSLDLGATPEAIRNLPTDRRLEAFRRAVDAAGLLPASATNPNPAPVILAASPDPELETLLFQYARYLLISSSRAGDLPANLQGLWNQANVPMWRCDYHSDVNLQMNYWFADLANLPGCFEPLAEWLASVIPVKREATAKVYKTRGWMCRSENGLFGGQSYHFVPGDAAWLAQNIWDHYAFTQDQGYLEKRAYPILKELCEFWEDYLKERPDGKLVSPKSISPEHGPAAEGNSYEQQLVWDLFTNTIEAARKMGRDDEFRRKVEAMRNRLLGPKIGKWGQLQEWAEDRDSRTDTHRHLSHLIAVYPGRQISPLQTPELAAAAKVSMNARGDRSTGWGQAWRGCIWARLHDGDRAYSILGWMVRENILPNLFDSCPPFQIDGNFGYAAAVGEMLVQSHESVSTLASRVPRQGSDDRSSSVELNSGHATRDPELEAPVIHLLPALPKAWPTGSVKGLCARGGYQVDIEWKDGKVTSYRIAAADRRQVTVRVNGETKAIKCEKN